MKLIMLLILSCQICNAFTADRVRTASGHFDDENGFILGRHSLAHHIRHRMGSITGRATFTQLAKRRNQIRSTAFHTSTTVETLIKTDKQFRPWVFRNYET